MRLLLVRADMHSNVHALRGSMNTHQLTASQADYKTHYEMYGWRLYAEV